MNRPLTNFEIQMLMPIFKNTLRYGSIVCTTNDANIGGAGNSITPAGVPHFSTLVYCPDFSNTTADNQWVFVHEMAHVWQWGHGIYPVNAAVGLFLQNVADYTKAYAYSCFGNNLSDFIIEHQAPSWPITGRCRHRSRLRRITRTLKPLWAITVV